MPHGNTLFESEHSGRLGCRSLKSGCSRDSRYHLPLQHRLSGFEMSKYQLFLAGLER